MPRFARFLFLSLAVAACGGQMPSNLQPMPVADGGPPVMMTPDAGGMTPVCGPTALCKRSINECAATLTQTSCEGWYANTSNCRDMAGYTACNCECIGEATCSDYFACGNLCFNGFCK